jgi:tetratricopeptide (TPR) repeat protein
MEGMVYRLDTGSPPSRDGRPRVDPAIVWTNMTARYDLGGVLDKDGNVDTSIHRDANTAYLLRNYPAALSQAAYYDVLDTNYVQARLELEMAYRFEPTFPAVTQLLPLVYMQLGEYSRAVELAQLYLRELRDPWTVVIDVGRGLLTVGEFDVALQFAQSVAQQRPEDAGGAQLLFDVYRARREYQEAERVLSAWVARSGDPRAAAELDTFRQHLRDGRVRGDAP